MCCTPELKGPDGIAQQGRSRRPRLPIRFSGDSIPIPGKPGDGRTISYIPDGIPGTDWTFARPLDLSDGSIPSVTSRLLRPCGKDHDGEELIAAREIGSSFCRIPRVAVEDRYSGTIEHRWFGRVHSEPTAALTEDTVNSALTWFTTFAHSLPSFCLPGMYRCCTFSLL